MGGFFGVASTEDCISDLFYGTDYHSHLGTKRGGMAVHGPKGYTRFIKDITNNPFRSKLGGELSQMHGNHGIGVISDYEDQPLLIASHLGTFAIVTVGVIQNAEEIAKVAFSNKDTHFSEWSEGEVNPTEVAAALIARDVSFEAGLRRVQGIIEGSLSILLLTEDGIYAARDRYGRTPIIIGRKDGAIAATLETSAFPNLDYEVTDYLGPNEIVRFDADGLERLSPPGDEMEMCSFLWIYYGYPASTYENINTEIVRNECGAALARRERADIDYVGGIPDSGIGHGIGYAAEAGLPYKRPFVKYTPTWPRSFMPQEQRVRDTVARMKLIPIKELIEGKKLLFCEDSIVRGTQLADTVQRLYTAGAKEIHMRPACPPLVFSCKFLNFSRSKSELDLATRKAIEKLEGRSDAHLDEYSDPTTDRYHAMLDAIREQLGLTTLWYQRLDDMIEAIGLPRDKLCTYCWNGQTCTSKKCVEL